MLYKHVVLTAAWLVGSSLLTVACAEGGAFGNASFGFGTETTTADPTVADDSVGTFNPADASAGPEGSDGQVSTGPDETTTGASTTAVGSTSIEGSSSGDGGAKCDGIALEPGEDCDGADLGGEDCASQGFDEGTLGCTVECTFDTAGCSTFTCGNGAIEGSEVCDGAQLGGQTCVSQGYDMGALGCLAGCGGYDFGGCSNIVCGNGVVEMGEICDGAQLGGQTCITQGFDGGNLGCVAGCAAYDTGGCIANCVEQDLGSVTGAGVAAGSTIGEDDTLAPNCVTGGADHVMSFTAVAAGNYVFDTFTSGYDTALAVFSDCNPGSQLACNDDTGGTLQSQVNVALGAGQTVNVVVDGYGGGTGNWVLNIQSPVPPLPACAEADLGSLIGSPVATGTTVGEDEDLAQNCGAGGVDYVLRFIAPAAATFQFDTVGSGYDTVLSLHDMCGGVAVTCNDDFFGLQSQVSYAMAAGQQVLIAVSGYAGNTGDWTLNIVQL
jgi:hypothetical protein